MAETAGYWTYSIASDEVTITSYVGNESRVVIPETLEGKPVVAIGENAFADNSKTEVIIVPATVTNIGNQAFAGATGLLTVAFKSPTPATLGESVFSMGYVRNMYVPTDAIDAYKTSWWSCASHIKADPTDADFTDNSGPVLFTYRVNDDYKTATVTGCTDGSITTFAVRGSASRMDDNGEYDYYNVTAIADGAFLNSWVERVSLPNSIKKIGARAFDNSSLQEVLIFSNSYHASLDPSECEIADDAFPHAADYHIYVPSDNVDDFQQAWAAFADKIAAYPTTVTVGDYEYSYKQYDLTSATVSLKKYNGSSSDVTLPGSSMNGDQSLSIIGIEDGVFADNKSIETVTIPYGSSFLAGIGHTTVLNHLFSGCSNLSKVFAKYCNNIYFGPDCFSGCSNLKFVLVPSGTYNYYKQNAANSQFYSKIVEYGGGKTLNDQEGLSALDHKTYYESGRLAYRRTLAADAQYATLCLPFDFDLSTAGFEQVYTPMNSIIHFVPSSAATGSAEAGQKEKLILMLKKYSDGKVAAGTPLFVKLGSDKNIDIVNASDVMLESSSSPNLDGAMTVVDWDGTSGLMEQNDNFSIYYKGTYQSQEASSISNLYTFNSDGTFGPQTSGTLNPFRMYLTVDSSKPVSAYSISIGVNDGATTGIRELVTTPTGQATMSETIYDLNGRVVSTNGSTKGLRKGVYIQNHKKIVVE